jgi:hypothetical protein
MYDIITNLQEVSRSIKQKKFTEEELLRLTCVTTALQQQVVNKSNKNNSLSKETKETM